MSNFSASIKHHPHVVSLFAGLDVVAVAGSHWLGRVPKGKGGHVVLTTTGHGNIGDQAMFEAYLANVKGPVTAIIPESGAFEVPAADLERVKLVEFEQLIYGRRLGHFLDLFRLGRILRGAKSFSVIGADIMDGGYNSRLSEMEWTTAIAARTCGLQVQILGFSWNASPVASVVTLAKWAGERGVLMNVRDPRSFERLEALGIKGIRRAADMVFLLGESDLAGVDKPALNIAKSWSAEGHNIALVNCSGLIDVTTDLVSDYAKVVEYLLAKDCRVMLVPHVVRPDSNDLDVCRRVMEYVPESRVYLVETLLPPRQVKALAEIATVILTGRMHLSVLGLSVGTPSIVLATQGKVEGLMQIFGRPEWNVEPNVGFASTVLPLLEQVIETRPATALIRANGIHELARKNFSFESNEMRANA